MVYLELAQNWNYEFYVDDRLLVLFYDLEADL
jgi:hypothetical protein